MLEGIENINSFHFIGLGGVGQSALAEILLELAYSVSGSDNNESKYLSKVKALGAKVYIGHNKDNIEGRPCVVVSSAIKEDNPELIKAKELKLNIIHRSDCLKFISERFPIFIGVSGTHGKTTTSGIISFVMEKMELDPAYAIGGIIPKLNKNASAKKTSEYFIAELDESDKTIEKYSPNYLIINNIEQDHLDNYKDLDDIIKTFKKTLKNMEAQDLSKIFINIDDLGVNKLFNDKINDIQKNTITFSLNEASGADYLAKNIEVSDFETSFDFCKNLSKIENGSNYSVIGKIKLIIPGVHNVYNALAAASLFDMLGFEFQKYSKIMSEFCGMGRRFQVVSDINNIKIIDDYAHHPTEIKSTIWAIQNIKRRKVVVFQPHRYTRLKALWEEFLESFYNIDKLIVLDVFSAGDKFDFDYNSEEFSKAINKKNVNSIYIKGKIDTPEDEIAKRVLAQLKEGDIVLTLGAGDITKLGEKLKTLMEKGVLSL